MAKRKNIEEAISSTNEYREHRSPSSMLAQFSDNSETPAISRKELEDRIKQLEAENVAVQETLNDWKRETFLLVSKIDHMLEDDHPIKHLNLYRFFETKIESWLIMEKSKNKLDNQ